jgi:hypothetical protein
LVTLIACLSAFLIHAYVLRVSGAPAFTDRFRGGFDFGSYSSYLRAVGIKQAQGFANVGCLIGQSKCWVRPWGEILIVVSWWLVPIPLALIWWYGSCGLTRGRRGARDSMSSVPPGYQSVRVTDSGEILYYCPSNVPPGPARTIYAPIRFSEGLYWCGWPLWTRSSRFAVDTLTFARLCVTTFDDASHATVLDHCRRVYRRLSEKNSQSLMSGIPSGGRGDSCMGTLLACVQVKSSVVADGLSYLNLQRRQ